MAEGQRRRLQAGSPPWDEWNGVRVGLLVGALIGVGMVVLVQSDLYWIALIPAALGGLFGYWSERRKRTDSTDG